MPARRPPGKLAWRGRTLAWGAALFLASTAAGSADSGRRARRRRDCIRRTSGQQQAPKRGIVLAPPPELPRDLQPFLALHTLLRLLPLAADILDEGRLEASQLLLPWAYPASRRATIRPWAGPALQEVAGGAVCFRGSFFAAPLSTQLVCSHQPRFACRPSGGAWRWNKWSWRSLGRKAPVSTRACEPAGRAACLARHPVLHGERPPARGLPARHFCAFLLVMRRACAVRPVRHGPGEHALPLSRLQRRVLHRLHE